MRECGYVQVYVSDGRVFNYWRWTGAAREGREGGGGGGGGGAAVRARPVNFPWRVIRWKLASLYLSAVRQLPPSIRTFFRIM